MAKTGPVIIIEDDLDDVGIFKEVLKDLNLENRIISFTKCKEAHDYLKTTTDQPFIIFCDVNLPGQSGLDFKREIDDDPQLRRKSIPFLFYSTSIDQKAVNIAYTEMTIQGFFQKENSFQEIKKTITAIFEYWSICRHPNSI